MSWQQHVGNYVQSHYGDGGQALFNSAVGTFQSDPNGFQLSDAGRYGQNMFHTAQQHPGMLQQAEQFGQQGLTDRFGNTGGRVWEAMRPTWQDGRVSSGEAMHAFHGAFGGTPQQQGQFAQSGFHDYANANYGRVGGYAADWASQHFGGR
eukprot:NODE_5731_length_643_cov_47.877104_g5342_i0.p2 GENE.NODE_5731_length_643_cov_47.877104_g5342_i0~~NODE_5731_length_643_cov_47.877104_g5342_i0.p2  ORF type:complete len:150 (-),score=29.35 NODE_5731_length_643_cov_47.877104_g5342_i0:92-541(-)